MFIGLGGHEPVLQQGIWMVTTDGKNFDLGDVFLRGGGAYWNEGTKSN